MRGVRLDGGAAAAACQAASGKPMPPGRASLWQGDQDSIVAPANLRALETMFARLAAVGSAVTDRQDGARRSLYRDRRGDALIEAWLVPGMGHAWSGGDSRGTHTWPPGPDPTHPLPQFLLAARVK